MTDELAAALERALPELRVRPLRVLDVGFGSTVAETADGVVVRVARTARAAAGHEREAALLPAIAPRLPVLIPDPRWRLPPDDELPFGAIAYAKLPGAPLAPAAADDAVAADVGAFLRALHAIDDAALPRAEDDLDALRAATTPALREELDRAELEEVDAWWEDVLADARLRAYRPVLRHGDLWYDNLLVDRGTLVGVVDWEAAGLGDAAEDFAALRHVGDRFVRTVLGAYGAHDPDLPHRIERRWQLRELYGVRLAVELGDASELADAVRKLRAGPVLGR